MIEVLRVNDWTVCKDLAKYTIRNSSKLVTCFWYREGNNIVFPGKKFSIPKTISMFITAQQETDGLVSVS